MKFIHCADLHLDSPLQGLTRYQGAPVDEMREATRRAFEQLIALALQEPVEFVVIAGDLFDGDWPDFNTGLFFVDQMVRLNEAGIKVFMVRGNHDAESRITRDLPLPSNVSVLPTTRPRSKNLRWVGRVSSTTGPACRVTRKGSSSPTRSSRPPRPAASPAGAVGSRG